MAIEDRFAEKREKLARIKGTDFVGKVSGPYQYEGATFYAVRFGLERFPSHLPVQMVEVFDAPRKPIPMGFFGSTMTVRYDSPSDTTILTWTQGSYRQVMVASRQAARELADWIYEVSGDALDGLSDG